MRCFSMVMAAATAIFITYSDFGRPCRAWNINYKSEMLYSYSNNRKASNKNIISY